MGDSAVSESTDNTLLRTLKLCALHQLLCVIYIAHTPKDI